jgi:hypothetical protein
MSDGRQFTDYRTRCARPAPSGVSCYDYKSAMIRDAGETMERDRQSAAAAVGGVWCDEARIPGVELITECSDRACTFARTGTSEPVGISTDNTRMQR